MLRLTHTCAIVERRRIEIKNVDVSFANVPSHSSFLFPLVFTFPFISFFFSLLRVNRRKVVVYVGRLRFASLSFLSLSTIKWRCSQRWSILVPNLQLASSNDDESQRATLRVWLVFLSVMFLYCVKRKARRKSRRKRVEGEKKERKRIE